MTELDTQGRRLLIFLIGQLPKVRPGKPETYITYKAAHEALGLFQKGRTFGESLRDQGLGNLASWTVDHGFPAISGLVVSEDGRQPGNGYFDFHGQRRDAFQWWGEEIAKAKAFDWTPYTGL